MNSAGLNDKVTTARSILRWSLAGICLPLTLLAVTLEELRTVEKLNSRKFAGYFKDFDYSFHEEIQQPEVFLETRSGDCDDYAILADMVLRERGFTTRLITVRMPGLVPHVVCYVMEDKVYLDYNNRIYLTRTEKADPDLRDIARKVAKSFEANWTSVSEFKYVDGLKELVQTISKTDAYAGKKGEEKKGAVSDKKITIDF